MTTSNYSDHNTLYRLYILFLFNAVIFIFMYNSNPKR